MSEQALKTVVEFNKLPDTDEKKAISKAYLDDDIGRFEFYQKASAYLNKVKEPAQ